MDYGDLDVDIFLKSEEEKRQAMIEKIKAEEEARIKALPEGGTMTVDEEDLIIDRADGSWQYKSGDTKPISENNIGFFIEQKTVNITVFEFPDFSEDPVYLIEVKHFQVYLPANRL